jgi:hypothetical protein
MKPSVRRKNPRRGVFFGGKRNPRAASAPDVLLETEFLGSILLGINENKF